MMSQQRALVRMPDVNGLPLKKAKLIIEQAGLSVESVLFQESYEARDTVLGQKPGRGQMLYAGEKVTLTVSRDSYIKWLPSIYQRADVNGKNFLRDYLWIIQHMFASIDETLEGIHKFFDPYEAPERFLPWLASWTALVVEEDWPVEKKRRLIRKALELYRIRGTVKGLKLFLSLFSAAEPVLQENKWPFRGWRIGVSGEVGVDTIVLPPVNLAHAFVVRMPVGYKDLSHQAVIRVHEILMMEKPASCQYYLQFAADDNQGGLQEFIVLGKTGIGTDVAEEEAITSEEDLARLEAESKQADVDEARGKTQQIAGVSTEVEDAFTPYQRRKPPIGYAPRADNAPVEGQEHLGRGTMAMSAVTDDYVARTMATPAVSAPESRKPLETTVSTARTMAIDLNEPKKKGVENDKTQAVDVKNLGEADTFYQPGKRGDDDSKGKKKK